MERLRLEGVFEEMAKSKRRRSSGFEARGVTLSRGLLCSRAEMDDRRLKEGWM
jgi:hypothetical protein